jgi:hypothetical protein
MIIQNKTKENKMKANVFLHNQLGLWNINWEGYATYLSGLEENETAIEFAIWQEQQPEPTIN